MIRAITRASVKLVERFLPDAFVLVLILTLVVFGAGMIVESQSPFAMAQYWGDGFWNLLAFTMQMILVLVTGFAVADTPLFRNLLQNLARSVKTPAQAIFIITIISMLAALINWGFALVIGALLGREFAKTVKGMDYRLAIASAYCGLMVWHGGLSGSIPLVIATEGHFTQDMIGVVPTSETIFSAMNLTILAGLFIFIPLTIRLIMPSPEETVTIDPKLLEEFLQSDDAPQPDATGLENSRVLSIIIGTLGLLYLGSYFIWNGGGINLNSVNFAMLFIGILLHGRPAAFLASVNRAVNGATGIIVQFPFYAGIMGMMVGSGLATTISEGFAAISTPQSFPLLTFLSAGIVNLFIPSGGGQWAVQAPIMLEAGAALGVAPGRTAMAVAWGDTWTNLIQSFWALPALAIAGLSAKDIMGFCLIVLVVTGTVIGLGLVFVP